MASAQLYWGRMAALLLRLTYMIFPQVGWGFVFVDDFCWILRAGTANLWATTLLATYLALGVPLSWKKTVLSEINTWLGFVVNPKSLVVRMAEDKHDIIMEILKQLPEGEVFTSKAIEKALGRLSWATSVCPLSRPFLQPFWSWKVACKTSGRPPKLVTLFAKMLTMIFSVPYKQPPPYVGTSNWWGASDASATKDAKVAHPWVGGCRSPGQDFCLVVSIKKSHQRNAHGPSWMEIYETDCIPGDVEYLDPGCPAHSTWRLNLAKATTGFDL